MEGHKPLYFHRHLEGEYSYGRKNIKSEKLACPEKKGLLFYNAYRPQMKENRYEERIFQLKYRIYSMKLERNVIEDSTLKLKMEIQDQMSAKMSLLRKREFQLYRQVDEHYNHQNLLIQEQLSKLHSVLGSYEALQYKYNSGCADNESDKNSSLMDSSPTYEEVMKVFPKQNLQFVVDDMNLKSVIESYGRLEVSGGHTGTFLLPDEYEDVDHHTLSKSISPGTGNSSLTMHFESLKSSFSALCDDINRVEKEPCVNKSSSNDSFEVLLNDVREFTKQGEHSPFHICDYMGDKDIESLSGQSCTSGSSAKNSIVVSQWLRKNEALDRTSLVKASSPISQVKRLCKANKKCSSYSACICKVNCLVSHLKEQMERLRSSDTSLFSRPQLNHTINQVIQSETQKNESIGNDAGFSGSLEDKMEIGVQAPFSFDLDVNGWLTSPKNANPVPVECETWLATTSSIEDEPDATDLVKGLFAPYFDNKNMDQWLRVSPEKNSSQCC